MARKNRTKLITLDEETFEKALQKENFSMWVRNQLRSERNKNEATYVIAQLEKEIELLQKQSDMWWRMYNQIKNPGSEEE